MSIKTLASRVVYKNHWMTLREDRIERADGSPGLYSVVDKLPAALVVPVEDGQVYLIEQYRYPVRARYLEFPQGTREEDPEADPLELARCELEEETGLRAGRMDYLGQIFYAYGITGQPVHIYRATQLAQGERRPEATEQDLVVKQVAIPELESMIRGGTIKDAGTIAAWSLHKML